MPLLSAIRSLHVTLPTALDDVGLDAHAAALRALPISTDAGLLLRAAALAEDAAAAAQRLAARQRSSTTRRQRTSTSPWPDGEAFAVAVDSAAFAASSAAAACRAVALHLRRGNVRSGADARRAALDSQIAAADVTLYAAAGHAGRPSPAKRPRLQHAAAH